MIRIDGLIDLHTGVLVDSCASSLGTRASQAVDTLGHPACANASAPAITIDATSVHTRSGIFGDATPGPAQAVSPYTEATLPAMVSGA